ncbi:hypothetical protein F441_05260, partial [Phytophthora nicotianae CJ01A1]
MASMIILSLYERILSHVNASELRRSSNAILQEEYSALDKSVGDVIATYAKVEEVRDAVNQLEQGKALTRRSNTLLEVMDSTLQLQQELHSKLTELADGMKVGDENKMGKRKRDEKEQEEDASSSDSSSSSSSSSSEDDSDVDEVEDSSKHKMQRVVGQSKQSNARKSATTSDKKDNSDLSLAHDTLAFLSKIRTVDQKIESTIKNQWAETLFNLKLILNRLSSRYAHTTDKSTAQVTARALEAAVVAFTMLESTPELAEDVRALFAVLSDACSKNEMLRFYFHRARAELESLEMNVSRSISESSGEGTSVSAMSLDDQLLFFQNLVEKVKILPTREKAKHIIEALDVMQHAMANDSHCARQTEVRYSAEVVKNWIGAVPFQDDLGNEFESYAFNLAQYSKKLKGSSNQVGWKRRADNLLIKLNEKRKQSTEKSHAPPTTSKTTRKMMDRLKAIITQVEQWQDGIFALNQLDKAIKEFGEVMSYKSKDWNALADPNSRACMDKLVGCIQFIKKQAHHDKYLKAVNKWKRSVVKN